ncbi:HD domain-containing phosphohydrolase [Seleniivibrio woodruffii]|uniref:HD domain-containing phosphohydrolase n=1 Tax=Seleniivibrio woodruffii TaxID=1078050 RepID=UPI0024099A39|nr:HD domain-containing phosphohydrolase [Seleniivibrio woodruffii]
MDKISLKELAFPIIKAIDSFNYLLKSHQRRTAVISYHIGKELGLPCGDIAELVVAAAMHDIGALSVQERDTLIKEDVENPSPHCLMGYKMLSMFDIFSGIAKIIRHHHIRYEDAGKYNEEIRFQSHIIHLADRVDIYLSPDQFILNQKARVTASILEKKGTVFHPDVCDAFERVSRADIFWIEINNLTMEQLFSRMNFLSSIELNREQIEQFALTISRIIDFRSRFTAGHSYTVGRLAQFIGQVLGLDDDMCEKLLIAGYFHDIGKIGIDTAYIEKCGQLTDEEYNMVKLHCYYSGQILSELNSSEWFRDVVKWSQHHHERLTGNGYPFAIKGEEIDTGTKIIAFSDMISALMEDRPYRKRMSIDTAFDIIDRYAAENIDPDMIKIIDRYKAEIETIVDQCKQRAESCYYESVEYA